MPHIETFRRGQVAHLRLNRPESKNAFTLEMIDTLADAVAEAGSDDAVRVLVLTGTGDTFCSGVDLSVLADDGRSPLGYKRILTERIHRVAYAIEDLGKPMIAAVNGSAIGAGMDLALMCDLRIAGSSACFSEAYIKAGIVPGAGGCFFLPRIVGRAKALELLLTGDMVDAQEARIIGLVNEVVEDAELEATTDALAQRLANVAPVAASMIKRATIQSESSDLRTALDLISSHMGVLSSTADTREALSALRERRDARFTGN